jgi:hypothetical protein
VVEIEGRFENQLRRHATTVEAVKVSFNSFEEPKTNLRRSRSVFSRVFGFAESDTVGGSSIAVTPQASRLWHFVRRRLDDERKPPCFFKIAFSVGEDGFRLFPEVT